MRSTLLTGFGVLVSILNTHSQYWEDFSSSLSGWTGDVNQFLITQDAELRSNGSGTAELELVTSTGIATAGPLEWRVFVQLPFSPSSSNNTSVWFSTQLDTSGTPQEGIYLQLGESGSTDTPELHVVSGTTDSVLIRGPDSLIRNGMAHEVRIRFDGISSWSMSLRAGKSGDYFSLGTASLSWVPSGQSVRIFCDFTSTRADLFHYDNLYTGPWVNDTIPPHLDSFIVHSPSLVELRFNERIIPDSLFISVDGSGVNPAPWANDSSIYMISGFPPIQNNSSFETEISGIMDLSGNSAGDTVVTNHLLIAETPDKGDIVVNEILFNPTTGGEDYIEVYNRSNKIFDMSQFSLARYNDDTLDQTKNCSSVPRYLLPGGYLVVTEDSLWVAEEYFVSGSNNFCEPSSVPTYWDDSGSVVLLYDSLIIDRVYYSEDMHYTLLADVEGVSLERIDPEMPSMDAANWGSASEAEWFGTPGRRNSQRLQGSPEEDAFVLQPEVFSPNGDGLEDKQRISIHMGKGEWVVTIRIFDRKGRLVRMLWNQKLIVNEAATFWDGLNDNRARLPMGPYIIVVEAFNEQGRLIHKKSRSVLAPK